MNSYRLYLLDDDLTTYDVLSCYLELAGFVVQYASDGRSGLEMIVNNPPDLVLLDIQMPELDGFQVISELRKKPETRDIPVLFISTFNRTNLKVKGLELGADDYILKPFERVEVVARVKAALRRSLKSRGKRGAMTGQLDDLGLAALLQTLGGGSKLARITLPDMGGQIFVKAGKILAAWQERVSGADALARLLLLNRGEFSVDFDIAPEQLNINESIQKQLLNSVVELDDIAKLMEQLAVKNLTMHDLNRLPASPELELLGPALPLPVADVLVSLPGKMIDTLKTLVG